jgi:hypothetical protein
MPDSLEPLILNLLDWLSHHPRTYAETLSAWRTSCPRLPVWEEANDRGLVEIVEADAGKLVRLTPTGQRLLKAAGSK